MFTFWIRFYDFILHQARIINSWYCWYCCLKPTRPIPKASIILSYASIVTNITLLSWPISIIIISLLLIIMRIKNFMQTILIVRCTPVPENSKVPHKLSPIVRNKLWFIWIKRTYITMKEQCVRPTSSLKSCISTKQITNSPRDWSSVSARWMTALRFVFHWWI